MDVIEIRLSNLRALVRALDERGVRLRKDQAQALGGLGSSYLSQLLRGKKMGESVARKIEAAVGKPHGWLDRAPVSEANCQPGAVWTLDALLSGLAERLHTASPAVRESAGELLLRFVTHPADRVRLAQALRSLLE